MRNLLLLALLALAASSQAVSLAVWNFNDVTSPPTEAQITSVDRLDAAAASAALSTDFTGGFFAAQGTTVGRDGADAAGRALRLRDSANNGRSLTFSVTKNAGFSLSNVRVSFATRRATESFVSNQFAYSADGTAFTDFGAPYIPVDTQAYGLQAFDLSGVSALNSATTLTFRITFDGATAATGINDIDNLVVSGDVQAVPEPASLAALGLGALALLRRRKA